VKSKESHLEQGGKVKLKRIRRERKRGVREYMFVICSFLGNSPASEFQ